MKKVDFFILLSILLGAFVVRLYRFNNPIADWHSWRQADTSSVSRNFVNQGFDLLRPRFDDISNVPSGLDNPNGYRFVEFPIYNVFQAGGFTIFDFFTLEEWGRLITIFSSLATTLFIFLIVLKYAHIKIAFFSAFFYAFIPYNIYYGRTTLPDPMMIMATMGGIYFFDKFVEKQSKHKSQTFFYLIASILFTSSALLLKPFAAFFLLPMFVIVWNAYGFNFIKKWELWVFLILSIAPLIWWRNWMTQYPEGIPVNNWLFNGNGIRFRPSFFRWMGYERITKLILGYFGLPLAVVGVATLLSKNKSRLFFLSILFSSIAYVCVVATGNVQHDYYQIPIIPSIAIFLGLGTEFIVHLPKKPLNKYIHYGVVGIVVGLSFWFGWDVVKDYFNINNHAIIEAGIVINEKTPKDAKVIALYDGDTTFLYQTHRRGWASFEKPLPEMIKMGAGYMAIVNPTQQDLQGFGNEYPVVAVSSNYLILKLQ